MEQGRKEKRPKWSILISMEQGGKEKQPRRIQQYYIVPQIGQRTTHKSFKGLDKQRLHW